MKNIFLIIGFIGLTTGFAFSQNTAADDYAAGVKLYGTKDYSGALQDFEAGAKLEDHSAHIFQGIGNCYFYLQRYPEAIAAFEKSLTINPNNTQLASFVESLKAKQAAINNAAVSFVNPLTATPTPQNVMIKTGLAVKLALDKGWWVGAYAGYDYALLGDLINGVNGWIPVLSQNNQQTTPSDNIGNSGIRAGFEFGMKLDKEDAISVNCENVWTQIESFTYGGPATNNYSESYQPDLMSVSLNYYRYIFVGKGSRTYLTIGGGYYHTVIGYSSFDTGVVSNPETTATFTGDTIGGTLGFGETLAIGDSFGVEISVRGRLAAFSQVTAPSLTNGTTTITTYAPYSIFLYNNTVPSLNGLITIGSEQLYGSYTNYAVIDYSGFDGDLSFDFYF